MKVLPVGYIPPKPKKTYRRIGPLTAALMLADLKSGLTPHDVAIKYGSCTTSVRRAVARYYPNGIKFYRSFAINEVGNTYGRLRVVAYLGPRTQGTKRPAYFKCICTCGTTIEVAGYQLRYGQTVSCGCMKKEKARKRLIDLNAARKVAQTNKGVLK